MKWILVLTLVSGCAHSSQTASADKDRFLEGCDETMLILFRTCDQPSGKLGRRVGKSLYQR